MFVLAGSKSKEFSLGELMVDFSYIYKLRSSTGLAIGSVEYQVRIFHSTNPRHKTMSLSTSFDRYERNKIGWHFRMRSLVVLIGIVCCQEMVLTEIPYWTTAK